MFGCQLCNLQLPPAAEQLINTCSGVDVELVMLAFSCTLLEESLDVKKKTKPVGASLFSAWTQ